MRVTFRPLLRADFPLLARWLAAPHVERWWRQPSDQAALEADYGPALDGSDPTEHLVVEVDGDPVGLVQRCRIGDYPDYEQALAGAGTPVGAATFDYLLGEPERIGRGLGPVVLGEAAAEIWTRYPEVPAIVVPVQQDNRRSWRALEKAGFTRAWSGAVVTDDPSDSGPSHVYLLERPR